MTKRAEIHPVGLDCREAQIVQRSEGDHWWTKPALTVVEHRQRSDGEMVEPKHVGVLIAVQVAGNKPHAASAKPGNRNIHCWPELPAAGIQTHPQRFFATPRIVRQAIVIQISQEIGGGGLIQQKSCGPKPPRPSPAT